MITSSNAIRGVNATKNPKHIRRYYVGTRVGEGQINESEQIGVRAGSSYARAEKDMPNGAMLLNAEKIIQRQIKEAAKDYHINQELDKLNDVFEEAKLAANREDINVLNEFQQDQRRIMQYHLSSGDIPPVFNKIQGGLYVKMLTTPYRLAAEAVSNTAQMMVRGRSFRGLLTALPSETVNPMYREMTDIMKATESTSLDHAEFRSMKNIETKDGQIQREGLLKRGVDVINGVTNAMAVGGIWMPNFNRKFAELTGENYNNSMLKNPKYVDAMREASSYADRETETVIGSTLKGGARREIVLTPFGGKLKADTALGSLAKFLSNYPYRDTKELVRGINQMVTGVNEGRIDGAARSMGVVTNMMLYTGMYAITKSLWKQTFGDDDEKKEAKETIDRLSTKEGFVDFTKQEALSNAVNLAGTKYSQAGKMMTRLSVIALYNSNLLDETQKKDLANFAEAQLYMYFNKKSFRKSDAQSEFYNVIPHRPARFVNYVYGLDFGYNHPTALVRVYWRDKDIYIEPVIYESYLTTTDLIARMDQLGIEKTINILADYSRPETIAEIDRAGYYIENANKVVKQGIDNIKTFGVFCEDHPAIKKEYENYKWIQLQLAKLRLPITAMQPLPRKLALALIYGKLHS